MSPEEPTVEPQIQTPSTTTTCPSMVPARGWRKSKWLIPARKMRAKTINSAGLNHIHFNQPRAGTMLGQVVVVEGVCICGSTVGSSGDIRAYLQNCFLWRV